MATATVTIISVPRERFSLTERSLEDIHANTRYPFEMIVVDGGSPPRVRRQIDRARERHGFRLLRTDCYLSPNEARNLGLREVETD